MHVLWKDPTLATHPHIKVVVFEVIKEQSACGAGHPTTCPAHEQGAAASPGFLLALPCEVHLFKLQHTSAFSKAPASVCLYGLQDPERITIFITYTLDATLHMGRMVGVRARVV